MTIEIAPPSTAGKVTATNEANGTKAKSSVQGKPQASGATGFMDILTSIDGVIPVELPVVDASLLSEEFSKLKNPLTDSMVVGTDADANPDATSLLAQAMQWMAPSVDGPLPNAGVVAPVPVPVGPAGQRADAPQRGVAGGGGEFARKDAQLESLPGAFRKGAKGPSDTATLQTLLAADPAVLVAGSSPPDTKSANVVENEFVMKVTPSHAEFASPVAAGIAKREEQNAMHAVFKPGSATEPAGLLSPSNWMGGAVGSTAMPGSLSTPESNPVTDAYVAEKVSYWISNDVKNAELTLDGIGEKPVEVTISMKGNEAHVAFRTDELQARNALENASLHLKEMLQREGLVLSGVTVGTSGGGDTGTQDRNSRQGGRQSTVIVDQSIRNEERTGGRQVVGRALDLFV